MSTKRRRRTDVVALTVLNRRRDHVCYRITISRYLLSPTRALRGIKGRGALSEFLKSDTLARAASTKRVKNGFKRKTYRVYDVTYYTA